MNDQANDTEERIGRCKFQLDAKTVRFGVWTNEPSFKFTAVYDHHVKDDGDAFSHSTPWGDLDVRIGNDAVLSQLELGEEYYIDIVKIPKR